MKWITALLLALAAASVLASPTEINAEYKVTNNGLVVGRVIETYVRTGNAYAISSRTTSEGLLKVFLDETVTLTSEGSVGTAGLRPDTFEQRQARRRGRDVRATFDWKGGVMHSESNGESKEHELPAGTQDRISVMYQFMNIAPRGDTIDMHMSNGRKVERYTYRKTEEVALSTPAGDFDTLHYERVTTEPGQGHAQVWLAKDRFNFPVRIVFDDPKGLRLDQTLVSLQAR
jgi:(2Fe-2S) ferredoxin